MKITYLDRYHCFNSTIMPAQPTIMKVGIAGVTGCDDMRKAKALYPTCRTIAYEADLANFEAMEQKAKGAIDHFINLGISLNRKIMLNRYKNSVSNSVYPRHNHESQCELVDTVPILAVTLQEALESNNVEHLHLLILNCEGAELEIMKMLQDEKLRNRIDQICVSFHNTSIYSDERLEEFLGTIRQFYHITRGYDCQKGGIPDWLMIRKA